MFKIGQEYNRRTDIQEPYGGQARGGISTPKNFSMIFIFTSDSGEQYGYRDEYRDGIFWYTGEGQIGDMKMRAGNKAILEHAKNGKTIYVFEYTRKAYVRYVGSANCLDYHEEMRPDRNGDNRKVFVFHLDIDSIGSADNISEPISNYGSKNEEDLKKKSISELRKAALLSRPVGKSAKELQKFASYRSKALKLYLMARAKGICEGCIRKAPFQTKNGPFLESHHVHRLADGGPDHPKNVVALCPNCHRQAHYSQNAFIFKRKIKGNSIGS